MKRPAGVPRSSSEGAQRGEQHENARRTDEIQTKHTQSNDLSDGESSVARDPIELGSRTNKLQSGASISPGARPRSLLRRASRDRRRFEKREMRRFTVSARRRRRAWLVSAGSVVGLGALAALLAFTPLLSVRQIVVEGTKRVSSDSIVSDLQSQLGSPFPFVDDAAIKAALVRYPLIQSYALESRPPSTLVVRVIERTPVGVIPAADGFSLVDAAGIVIEVVPQRPDNYPVIAIPADATSGSFDSAANVIRALPETFRSSIDTVDASSPDSVTLTIRDTGTRVVWGSALESTFKSAVLASILTNYPDAPYVDVSSPDVPVVRTE